MARNARAGYLVLWKGAPMRETGYTITKRERGRLFYPSGYTTVWATYHRARQAMVTAIRAWGKEDGMWWRVVALRAQRAGVAKRSRTR